MFGFINTRHDTMLNTVAINRVRLVLKQQVNPFIKSAGWDAYVFLFDESALDSARSVRLMKETLNMTGRFVKPGMCGTSLRCSGSITNGWNLVNDLTPEEGLARKASPGRKLSSGSPLSDV